MSKRKKKETVLYTLYFAFNENEEIVFAVITHLNTVDYIIVRGACKEDEEKLQNLTKYYGKRIANENYKVIFQGKSIGAFSEYRWAKKFKTSLDMTEVCKTIVDDVYGVKKALDGLPF